MNDGGAVYIFFEEYHAGLLFMPAVVFVVTFIVAMLILDMFTFQGRLNIGSEGRRYSSLQKN